MNERLKDLQYEKTEKRRERSEKLTGEGATFDYAADSVATLNRGMRSDLGGREIGGVQVNEVFGGGVSRLFSLSLLWFL